MSFDALARFAARRLDQDVAGGPPGSYPASDPYLASWLGLLTGRTNSPRIESGIIVDVIPGAYCYRVAASTRSYLWCSPGGATGSFGAFGQRPLTSFPIGSTVYFIRHPQTAEIGTIVAAEPNYLNPAPIQRPADGIWPFVRSGQFEAAHLALIQASQALAIASGENLGGVDGADFSGGRPMDATAVGEWGTMAETGVGVFADPFQAYLRVDETTGVFAFYDDQMLRVAGHNYQFFTGLKEEEHLHDEYELAGVTRKWVYPWEASGNWRYNQITAGVLAPITTNQGYAAGQGVALEDPLVVQQGAGVAVREPEYPGQIPAARGYEWSGYLGQGGKEMISAPITLTWQYPSTPTNLRDAKVYRLFQAGAPNGRVALLAPAAQFDMSEFNDQASFTNVSDVYETALEEALGSGEPLSPAMASIFAQIEALPPGPVPVTGTLDDSIAARASNAVYNLVVPPNIRRGPDQPGLLDEQKALTGAYHLRSAKRIILSKRASIPTPRPLARPEDPDGDSVDSGYSPSGLYDNVSQHKVKGELEPSQGPMHRMAMLPDIIAYAFNWEGLHPFVYHEKDWAVAEEGAAGSNVVNQAVPTFADLEDEDSMDTPGSLEFVDVDHRYGLVNIYPAESLFAMLDDGSVVIEDGWGSCIRMCGGHIEFHAPGDVRTFTGRNVITWAGRDFTMKAHNSVDLAAVNGDFRTMAGRNSHHLAGNAGCGGFLFESKAECPALNFPGKVGQDVVSSGFIVFTPKSQFLVESGDVCISLSGQGPDKAKIALDSGSETGEVHIRAKSMTSTVAAAGSFIYLFEGGPDADFPGGSDGAIEFASTYAAFGGDVYVRERLTTDSGAVAAPTDAELSMRIDYLTDEYGSDLLNAQYAAPGNEDMEFTLRTTTQYRAEVFDFWRPKWQAIGASVFTQLWQETVVTGARGGSTTRPHPGTRWTEVGSYKYPTHQLVDTDNGWVAKPRTANKTLYETYETQDPNESKLESLYYVTAAPGP